MSAIVAPPDENLVPVKGILYTGSSFLEILGSFKAERVGAGDRRDGSRQTDRRADRHFSELEKADVGIEAGHYLGESAEPSKAPKLDERHLAESLGVGRTPVREALARLEQEGLVQTISRRGVFVVRKTKAEIIEIVTAWAALESMAARLATANATDDEIANLRTMFMEEDGDRCGLIWTVFGQKHRVSSSDLGARQMRPHRTDGGQPFHPHAFDPKSDDR